MNVNYKTIDLVALTLAEKYKIHLQMTDFEDKNECVLQYKDTKWNTTLVIVENISKKNLPFWLEKVNNHHKFILISEYINENIGSILKDKNIQYADSIGNLYLEETNNALNLFIYRNDFKKITKKITYSLLINNKIVHNRLIERNEDANLKNNTLFTEKTGLLVLFAILCDENLITGGVRDLASSAGVGFGSAQKYKKALKNLQYLVETKQGWQLHKRKKLIERWIIGYQEILKPKYTIGRFDGLDEKWQNTLLGAHTYWSGEPAAELLDGHLEAYHFDIYTADEPENLPFTRNNKGNITLLEAFWTDLPVEEPFIVPTLLVYADLMCSKSPRNHEIAQKLYEKYLLK